MSVRNVRVNNYLKKSYEECIDQISKIYIIGGYLTGMYRLPVVFKINGFYKILALFYSMMFSICATSYFLYKNFVTDIVIFFNLGQYLVCVALTAMSWKTVVSFYKELFEIDSEIESKFLMSSDAKRNVALAVATYVFIILFNVIPHSIGVLPYIIPEMLPMDLNYLLEVYYYGHLFSLLNNRLKSIRILLLFSYPVTNFATLYEENESIDSKNKHLIEISNENSKKEIKKLMFLYFKIIKAYDLLNSILKWQLLVILATSFITTLFMAYQAALRIINGEFTWEIALFDLEMSVIRVAPVIVPCKFGEKLYNEVLLLRAALHSRIYNNVFDKRSRSVASSFLALTEARSLSFSLFRMIEINLTMPFKLLGLIASYVVILLQFQKVLNFDRKN